MRPAGGLRPSFASLRTQKLRSPSGDFAHLLTVEFKSMVALAILRVEKLKYEGNVGGSSKHTARLQDTPNADKTKKNIRLTGTEDGTALEDLVKTKIASTTKHKPRKDAVLCSDIFLSASLQMSGLGVSRKRVTWSSLKQRYQKFLVSQSSDSLRGTWEFYTTFAARV